jgi:hypothetical protein
MSTLAAQRRELAHRSADGIEVSLFWDKVGNRVTIEVIDRHLGGRIGFEVARDRARHAFHHPCVNAPAEAPQLVETSAAAGGDERHGSLDIRDHLAITLLRRTRCKPVKFQFVALE